MDIPSRFLATESIAPETFVIRQVVGEGMGGAVAPVNSMVIRAAEPVIVDTGMGVTRDDWLEHAFELVDPVDVRWLFLSHDDNDHIGALFDVLERCPKATLLAEMFGVQRLSTHRPVPLDRVRILNRGESFAAGDRTLAAIVPPVFDNQTTRGLYDPTTGVYWAADAFAIESARAIDDPDELPGDELRESFLQTQRLMSPWTVWLDADKYHTHLATVRSLQPTVAVGAHGPAFRGTQVETAFRLFEELPYGPPAHLAQQSDLELILAAAADPQTV